MKPYLLPLVVLLSTFLQANIRSQNTGALDRAELQQAVAQHPLIDSAGFAAHITLANHWIYHKPDSAEYYVDKIIEALSEHPEIPGHMQDAPYLIKAWVFQSRGQLERARQWMKKALATAQRYGDTKSINTIQLNLLSTFNHSYSPQVIAEIDTFLGEVDTTQADGQYIFLQLHNLKANQLLDGGYTKLAVEEILTALESGLVDRNKANQSVEEILFNLLGYVFSELNETSEALSWMEKSRHSVKKGSLSWQWTTASMASLALKQKDVERCVQLLTQLESFGVDESSCSLYYEAKMRLAVSKKNLKEAALMVDNMEQCSNESGLTIQKIKTAIIRGQIAHQRNDFTTLKNSIEQVDALRTQHPSSFIPRHQRDFAQLRLLYQLGPKNSPARKSFLAYIKASRLLDSLSRTRTTKELAVAYQTRIRQDSIADLTIKSSLAEQAVRSRNRQLLLAGLLAFGLVVGLFYFRQLNARLAAKNKEIQSQNDQILNKNTAIKHQNQRLAAAQRELEDQNHQILRLNQELNHRTSNYLDSIIILLERQRDSAAAVGLDISIVNSLERQVLAFTRVQDKLSADLDTVNLKEYLEDFCDSVRKALAAQNRPVRFDTNIADIDVKPAFAAPLALIINELATNSMKYSRREDGILHIALDAIEEANGELRVFYRDGGRQEGEVNYQRYSSGQGVELILGFTEELNGQILQYGKESYNYEALFGVVQV